MTSWWQLWRNTFFTIFDVEHQRNGKRYRNNSFTVAMYSTKSIIWPLVSIFAIHFFFFEDTTKSRTALEASRWAEFRSLFGMKICLLFSEISSKICESKVKFNMPSGPQLWPHDYNYHVMNFLESFISKISGTERDTEIILSLLQSTRKGYHLASYFNNCNRKKFIFKYVKKSRMLLEASGWAEFRPFYHFSESKYLF